MPPDPLKLAIAETISSHPEAIQRWLDVQPGAWGYLAAQGVLAYRRHLGRRLWDSERRALWSGLWAALEEIRASR